MQVAGLGRMGARGALRRRLEGLLRDHERAPGARERIDWYIAKRFEKQVGDDMAKKAGADEEIAGSSGGPKVTPDSRL